MNNLIFKNVVSWLEYWTRDISEFDIHFLVSRLVGIFRIFSLIQAIHKVVVMEMKLEEEEKSFYMSS